MFSATDDAYFYVTFSSFSFGLRIFVYVLALFKPILRYRNLCYDVLSDASPRMFPGAEPTLVDKHVTSVGCYTVDEFSKGLSVAC